MIPSEKCGLEEVSFLSEVWTRRIFLPKINLSASVFPFAPFAQHLGSSFHPYCFCRTPVYLERDTRNSLILSCQKFQLVSSLSKTNGVYSEIFWKSWKQPLENLLKRKFYTETHRRFRTGGEFYTGEIAYISTLEVKMLDIVVMKGFHTTSI